MPLTKEELKPFFVRHIIAKDECGHVIGWGRRKSELKAEGFTKKELRAAVSHGHLTQITARASAAGPIEVIYVYSDPDEMERLRELVKKIAKANTEKAKA